MAKWNVGDRVRVVDRPCTEDDRKSNRYFPHMAGLVGTVQNVYSADEVAVQVEVESLGNVAKEVHSQSTKRMREKFLGNLSEVQRSKLTEEEKNFSAHYVLLVRASDLEKFRA